MIGRTVGRYRILAKLGEGGMGSVWRAEDPLLGRTIALKFLPESLAASPESRRRFLREAQAASVLNHTGIATVFDAGEADGVVYIAMLLVDGETISHRVAGKPLRLSEAVRVAEAAAEALAHAHAHGVLHRDVTGRNIMLARDGQVVVVDFGLALPEGHTQFTQTGTAMGTAAYMAPEVAQGERADRRSDLYGLGVVLYEMLTGTLPFRAERGEALLYAAVHKPPEPPSRRQSGVPTTLDSIVLKTLAKDPARRYQTAEELLADLRAFQSGKGMVTPAPTTDISSLETAPLTPTPYPEVPAPGAPTSRHERKSGTSWGRIMVVVSLLAVALLTCMVLWKTGVLGPRGPASTPSFSSVAILPLKNMSEKPAESDYLAAGISRSLAIKFTQALGLRVAPYDTSQRFSDLSRPMQEIARELRVEALVVGTFTKVGDLIHCSVTLVDGKTGMQFWAEEFEEPSGQLFAVQRRIATGVAAKLKGTITGKEEQELIRPPAQSVEAYDFYLRGASAMQAEDREAADTALAFFKKAVDLDPNLAEAYVGIGAVNSEKYFYGWEGRGRGLEEAKANFQRALALNPNLPNALAGLIKVSWMRGDGEECLKLGKRAASLGREDVDTLLARSQAYIFGGIADKAVPLLQRTIALDPANPGAHWFLVLANVWSGRHKETIKAGNIYLRKFEDDPEIERMIAWSLHSLGDLDQAQVQYERAMELYGEDSPDTAIYLGNLYEQAGKPEQARKVWLKAVEILTGKLNDSPDSYEDRIHLALLYGYLGDRAMLEKEESLLPPDYMGIMDSSFLIVPHAALGDTHRVRKLLRQAIDHKMYQDLAMLQLLAKPLGAEPLGSAPEFQDLFKEFEKIRTRLHAEY